MDVFELTHKVMARNGGGESIPVRVVDRDGKFWPVAEACRLTIKRQAAFLYRSELLTDLAMLPVAAP
jgi:hypothetical protein